jgi:radical SAM superfamily enzyme YgiQ (UPF0313 family)
MAQLTIDHAERYRTKLRPQVAAVGSEDLKADILLTHAYYLARTRGERKEMRPYVPLGSLYVAAYLRQEGHRVAFFDTTFKNGIDEFARALDRYRPALVGISVMETTRANAVAMIRLCGERGITVVAGGPDASAEPEYYIENGARFVVVGEGERTMAELLTAVKGGEPVDGIDGLFTADGFFRPRSPIENLDELPFPAHDLVDYPAYFAAWKERHGFSSLQLSVSRGCPYRCSWCSKPVFGSGHRIRSAKNIAEEMQFVKMLYQPDRIRFADEIFSANADWVRSFRDEVLARRARIPFECISRVDLVDGEVLASLRDAGCFRIWYGIESGSQKMLERMRKDFNVEDVRRAARLTKGAGIEVGYYVMLGYPSEEIADVELTRRLIRETRPDRCGVTLAYPQKGSRFYAEVERDLLPLRFGDRRENDNLLTFKSRYSQNFYDVARGFIACESHLYAPAGATLLDRVKYGMYKLGYGVMKTGNR